MKHYRYGQKQGCSFLHDIADRYCRIFQERPDVEGVCLVGSLATGSEDDESDIDLVVVVQSSSLETEIAAAPSIVSSAGEVLVEGAVFGPRSHSAILSTSQKLVKIDFDYIPLLEFEKVAAESYSKKVYLFQHKVVFDRSNRIRIALSHASGTSSAVDKDLDYTGFSVGAYSALRMIKRGEFFEAFDILSHMRDPYVTTLLCHSAGVPFENFRRLESKLPQDILDRLSDTVCSPQPQSLLSSLCCTIELFNSLVPKCAISLADGTHRLLDLVLQQAQVEGVSCRL